jgi:hypothetical protein
MILGREQLALAMSAAAGRQQRSWLVCDQLTCRLLACSLKTADVYTPINAGDEEKLFKGVPCEHGTRANPVPRFLDPSGVLPAAGLSNSACLKCLSQVFCLSTRESRVRPMLCLLKPFRQESAGRGSAGAQGGLPQWGVCQAKSQREILPPCMPWRHVHAGKGLHVCRRQ